MTPEPGLVQILGLYEGPTEAWSPLQDQLVDSLRRAGVPTNLLRAVISGGRASLEPDPGFFPREQFASNPGEAVALALDMLLTETANGQPEDWFSTLRLIEYHEDKRVETFLQVHPDGVRGISREQPWNPIPKKKLITLLREQWWMIVLIVVGVSVSGWLKRDSIQEQWDHLQRVFFSEDFVIGESVAIEPNGFDSYLQVTVLPIKEEAQLVIEFSKRDNYPDSPAAIDALRTNASMAEAAALSAIELGYVQLEITLDNDSTQQVRVSLNQWNQDGKYLQVFDTDDWQGRELRQVRLFP